MNQQKIDEILIAYGHWVANEEGNQMTHSETKEALLDLLLGLPELQSEWEEDIQGNPNPNGVIRNEERKIFRQAITAAITGSEGKDEPS